VLVADGVLIGGDGSDSLAGGAGDDVLLGGNGNDELKAGEGFDMLMGGTGDDRLYSGSGADVLDGGSGWDTVSYARREVGVQVYLWDVSRNQGAAKGDTYKDIEVIDGTRFGDVIEGDSAANGFWGDAGDDLLKGGAGLDTLSGADGNDTLDGGSGADALNGGAGHDTASYGTASAGVGVYLHNIALNSGDAAGDSFVSIEVLDGSEHGDTLEGSAVANTFSGNNGHDVLKGFGGTDTLKGGSGGDQLSGGAGADLLDGGADFDFAVYTDAASRVLVDLMNMARNQGEAAGDVYVSIEGLKGSSHNDEFSGTSGWDGFYGQGGDDVLEGRGGGDQLDGGEGFDFAVYWGAASGVTASLLAGYGLQGDAAGDAFVSIEGLQGSNHADTLSGNGVGNTLYGWGGNDRLEGYSGNDYIHGGDGADTLSGGEGRDWLVGGTGRDVFRFDQAPQGAGLDTIEDFSVAEDRIALSTNVFGLAAVTQDPWTGVVLNGSLTASTFKVGGAATASSHRIVYDQGTGALYYDADGSGAAAQVQFAKVQAGTALTAAHFQLFTL
jgi:serralysin